MAKQKAAAKKPTKAKKKPAKRKPLTAKQKAVLKKSNDQNAATRKARQAAFIEIYQINFGNKTDACNRVGVQRKSFYMWYEKYPEFAKAFNELDPITTSIEYLEAKAWAKIEEGSEKMLIFALKSKANWDQYSAPVPVDNNINVTIVKADNES